MYPLIESDWPDRRADDERYMRLALCQARKGLGRTSPNPAVGALVVHNGIILSNGWHKKAGGLHAEIQAWDGTEAVPPCLQVTNRQVIVNTT